MTNSRLGLKYNNKFATKRIEHETYFEAKIFKITNGVKKLFLEIYAFDKDQLDKEIEENLKLL